MKVICCYCKKDLGDKAPFEDDRISHGACKKCFDRQMAIIANLKVQTARKQHLPVNSAY